MKTTLPPLGEITARGEQSYNRQLQKILEPVHRGQFAVINVDTGEYELASDHLTASQQAAKRWPNGLLYAIRIGSATVGHIGARLRKAD